MGSDGWNADEKPVHEVKVASFWMDETEVTVSAFQACPSSAGCGTPATASYCNWSVGGRGNHPVNCVDWNQARAYCRWRGGDLPTEAQWEFAARGSDGRTYPWGNDAPGSQLCWGRWLSSTSYTCPVRSFPSTNNALFDMAGNVWEWTLDWYAPYTGSSGSYVQNPTGGSGSNRVFRGGAWDNSVAIHARAAFRNSEAPTYRYASIGFRCAAAPNCSSGACSSSQSSCPEPTARGCGQVDVVGGTFTMGGDASSRDGIVPQANITVGDYTMDAYEVTLGRFRRFWSVRDAVLAGIRSRPIGYPDGTTLAWGGAALPPLSGGNCNWTSVPGAREDHPLHCVDWWAAQELSLIHISEPTRPY